MYLLAESEGFEPSIQVDPVCFLSREVLSTTQPALLFFGNDTLKFYLNQKLYEVHLQLYPMIFLQG